jgi:vesicle coat complex subunit
MASLFDGAAKGEALLLRDDLDGNDPDARKAAAKRCVSLMRAGENVSHLFSSMLRCVKTNDIELKKLVYLYLQSYSSQEPEQAIMAVNTFVTDSQDASPLVRALAVRTMCRIRLESVAEYMVSPLKRTLADKDPYVRKTAAFGVSKLFDMIPDLVETSGLLDDLLGLLSDENPLVIANTTAALFEINQTRATPVFVLTADKLTPILSALVSCSEWCQTILYEGLAAYVPTATEDADFLIDRFTAFLKHSNPAVVIGAFRCILAWMPLSTKDSADLFPQIIPPFVTLMTLASPEVQYVVLRALSLFIYKYPRALTKEIRVFFCKYNDPSYVKMEKLDVIVTICRPQTAQLVLDELQDYVAAVDVAFVRKAIRSIGQIALKIEAAARRCVDILASVFAGKADYAIEEAIIVLTDILRRYPGTFESILQTACQTLEHLKDPRAKAAGVWILGEYCALIENVDVLLDPFLDTFHDEQPAVQLQILIALVKLYIDRPDATRDQLQFVLSEASKESNVPDVRTRALIYWRLLSADAQTARDVVLFSKQTVADSGVQFADAVLDELLRNMGNVAGVLHVVPADFVSRVRFARDGDDADDDAGESLRIWRQLSLNNDSLVQLFADYDRANLYLRIASKAAAQLSGFALAVNKNAVGLALAGQGAFPPSLEFGDVAEVVVPIKFAVEAIGNPDSAELQIALRTSAGPVFALGRIPVEFATQPLDGVTAERFADLFTAYASEVTVQVEDVRIANDAQLAERNIVVVAKSEGRTDVALQLPGPAIVLASLAQKGRNIVAQIKAQNQALLPIVQHSVQPLFGQK